MPTNHVPNPERDVYGVTKLPNVTTKVSKRSLMLAVLMKIAQEERTRELKNIYIYVYPVHTWNGEEEFLLLKEELEHNSIHGALFITKSSSHYFREVCT